MKKFSKSLALLSLMAVLFNCVGIKSGKYSAVKSEEFKVESGKKSKIFIDWGFRTKMDKNPPSKFIDKAASDQKKVLVAVINESNCCEIVNEKKEADILVEGFFRNETSQAGLYAAFISGYTFTIIPCWTNSKMRIVAKVSKNKMVKDYDVNDSVFIAFWAPLIVATPFANPFKAEPEVNLNLYKNLIAQMKQDGFFERNILREPMKPISLRY